MKGGFAAIRSSKIQSARHRGNRSIAIVGLTERRFSIVTHARKGASFSLRSKENFASIVANIPGTQH
jgi:hypothetical protein